MRRVRCAAADWLAKFTRAARAPVGIVPRCRGAVLSTAVNRASQACERSRSRFADGLREDRQFVFVQPQHIGKQPVVDPAAHHGGEPLGGAVERDVLANRAGGDAREQFALLARRREHLGTAQHVDEIERRLAHEVLIARHVARIDGMLERQPAEFRLVAVHAVRQRDIDVDLVESLRGRCGMAVGFGAIDAVRRPEQFAERVERNGRIRVVAGASAPRKRAQERCAGVVPRARQVDEDGRLAARASGRQLRRGFVLDALNRGHEIAPVAGVAVEPDCASTHRDDADGGALQMRDALSECACHGIRLPFQSRRAERGRD
ncbi:hypothetical protein PT2222_150248 [Paraburkholderia tropica]